MKIKVTEGKPKKEAEPLLTWAQIVDKPGVYIPESYPNSRIIVPDTSEQCILFVDVPLDHIAIASKGAWMLNKFTKADKAVTVIFSNE